MDDVLGSGEFSLGGAEALVHLPGGQGGDVQRFGVREEGMRARVVLPQPGGPHRIIGTSRSWATIRPMSAFGAGR